MKKNIISALFISIIIIALFSSRVGKGVLREIKSSDAWDSPEFIDSTWYPQPQFNMQPAAFHGTLPVMQGEVQSQLIKELGIGVVPITGGKVKIAGVMGNSWADKAGLKRDDIVLRFNKKKIKGLKHFKALVMQATPEKKYKIKILRDGMVKSCLVTMGEGEMEGFTPIPR